MTKEFLKLNPPLNLIVRSHECMTKGFKLHHHDQVITVFSASNYTGTVGNDGALVVFERDGGTVLGGAAVMGSPRPGAHAAGGRPGSPAMGRSASPTMGHAAAASAATPRPASPMSLRSPRLGPMAPKDATLHLPGPSGSASAAAHSSTAIVPLKRSILPFYASRKEKNASYRVTAGSNLETDIVAKLLHLISDHRLSLIDHWSARAQQHSSGVWTVTRAVWASGLKACLGLSLPFLEFQELLGLPRLGVDGKPKGPVDFMAFLLRFRPVNLLVLRAQKNEANAKLARSQSDAGAATQEASQDGAIEDLIPSPSPSPDGEAGQPGDATVASLQQILELLHQKRFELESLFRFLDSDGLDTRITAGELGATLGRSRLIVSLSALIGVCSLFSLIVFVVLVQAMRPSATTSSARAFTRCSINSAPSSPSSRSMSQSRPATWLAEAVMRALDPCLPLALTFWIRCLLICFLFLLCAVCCTTSTLIRMARFRILNFSTRSS